MFSAKTNIVKSQPVQWAVVAVLCAAYAVIKYFYPVWVEHFFTVGQFDVLNSLTGSQTQQSLDFYVGKAEETFFGPLMHVLSGAAFLMVAWRYLPNAPTWMVTAAVFVYFLVTKTDILFWPPYGDSASGPFAEALWLHWNNFDYAGLYHEKGFVFGGPKVYLFSIYPTLMALLIKAIPHAPTFLIVNHLVTFALSAVTIAYVRRIALKLFDERGALLVSLLLLSFPLFQSQAEQINMEMPATCLAVMAMFYLTDRRFLKACLFAGLAAWIKVYALSFAGAVFAMSVIAFFGDRQSRGKKNALIAAMVCLGIAVLFTAAEYYFFNTKGKVAKVGIFLGWQELKKLPVTYLCLASAVVFVGIGLFDVVIKRRARFVEFIERHYVIVCVFAAVAAWYLLFLQSWGAQYRYRLILAPFSLLCVFYVAHYFLNNIARGVIFKTALVAAILLSSWCAYGFLYPFHQYSIHSALERSLEYRNDMKVQLELTRFIEENYSHFKIGAPFTIAQTLGLPELGYVTKKLDVTMYEHPCTYGGIEYFRGLSHIDIKKTLWVGFDTAMIPQLQHIQFPVSDRDLIIKEIVHGDRKATLFMGGFGIEQYRLVMYAVLQQLMDQGKINDIRTDYIGK